MVTILSVIREHSSSSEWKQMQRFTAKHWAMLRSPAEEREERLYQLGMCGRKIMTGEPIGTAHLGCWELTDS